MYRIKWFVLSALLAGLVGSNALAGEATPHLISFQGQALDNAGNALATGNLAVRIYNAATEGVEVYNSGTDFNGAIHEGVFSVTLGSGITLSLDNTRMYYLEVDINGQEVVGDAVGGRKGFYPGSGSHERSDLELRIQTLEHVADYTCPEGWLDLNGYPWDTCEFQIDPSGVYVAPPEDGGTDDMSCGDPLNPCATINYGISRASSMSRVRVHVMNGMYQESVTLTNGISLLGGYGVYWNRDVAATSTIISGGGSGTHKKTVVADGISSTTEVSGFVIRGGNNTNYGGNTYTVWVTNSPGLVLQNNEIQAANGGPGQPGTSGTDGGNGNSGSSGVDAYNPGNNPCSATRLGGAGGSGSCGATNVSGGNGGNAVCPPDYNRQFSARDGQNGQPSGGGARGFGGWDSQHEGSVCVPPSYGMNGSNGSWGMGGAYGTPGQGAYDNDGTVVAGEWIGSIGVNGQNGGYGSGGGGGGAGGGSEGYYSSDPDLLGGTGGGGGSGGCGGGRGTGGGAGGGSFCVFVVNSSAPVINGNRIVLGTGGKGGDGGFAGFGGLGGSGGLGGGNTAQIVCVGYGGYGGLGGNGGNGGGGGGGCGGVAYGVYVWSVTGAPSYSTLNTFTPGFGGAGGKGGGSHPYSGGDGATGDDGNTNQ